MILSTLLPASIGNGDDRFTLPYRLAHRAEKGPRFSALSDALFPKGSIGWIPKVGSAFGSDARIVRKSGPGFPRAERCAAQEKEHRMHPKSGVHFWVRCSGRVRPDNGRGGASDAAARPNSATGPSGAVRLLPAAVRPMSTAAAAPATLQRRPGRRRWTARSPLPLAMRTPRHTCGARACPGSARRRAKNALSARRRPANAEQPS